MYYVCRTTKNLKQKKNLKKEKSACFFVLDYVLVCVGIEFVGLKLPM